MSKNYVERAHEVMTGVGALHKAAPDTIIRRTCLERNCFERD